MADENKPSRSPLQSIFLFVIVVLVPLAVGWSAAPRLVPQPEIGIVRLSYDINSLTAYEITEQLAYARTDPAVKAVVLVINSPGGSAAYSEELYLDVLNLRADMPVVASVDLLAASGAYYMAAAADEIYAKPTSAVGSIGVISSLPGDVYIEEEVLTTGPYKAFGGTRDGSVRQIERAKFAFLEAVRNGRSGRLEVSDDVLSRAEIFTGVQALEMGLIDGLLANEEAVQKAAELAGISNFKVVELYPLTFDGQTQYTFAYEPPPIDQQKLWAQPSDLAPGLYYRYLELPSYR
ncbi:MAG: S49 family peptidase [Ardenticatenaceae bacterium]|nr:S49 family peptidase [Ardenticatenaceae bacterium]MCB9442809.1 S49 family peptidase [Ardenticatenaceae bacterium]